MSEHTGDLVITNDIRSYLGGNIVIPSMPSLSAKKVFTNQVVEHCFTVLADKQGGMKEEPKLDSNGMPLGEDWDKWAALTAALRTTRV